MKRGIIIIFSFLIFLTAASCATTRGASVESKRRGLLMLEGENIYKNKGFYDSKKTYKRRKNNMKAARRYYRR
jgi:hypothetical protein